MSSKGAAQQFKLLNGHSSYFAKPGGVLPPKTPQSNNSPMPPPKHTDGKAASINPQSHQLKPLYKPTALEMGKDESALMELEEALANMYLANAKSPFARSSRFTKDFTEMYSDSSLDSLRRRKQQLEESLAKRKQEEESRAALKIKLAEDEEEKIRLRKEKREQRRLEAVRQNSAAMEIQRVLRGYFGRKQYKRLKEEKMIAAANIIKSSMKSHLQIQRAKRELDDLKLNKRRLDSGRYINFKIVTFMKIKQAKKILLEKKRERDEVLQKEAEKKMGIAAVQIQRIIRGAQGRKKSRQAFEEREKKREERRKETQKKSRSPESKKTKGADSKYNRGATSREASTSPKGATSAPRRPPNKAVTNRMASKKSLILHKDKESDVNRRKSKDQLLAKDETSSQGKEEVVGTGKEASSAPYIEAGSSSSSTRPGSNGGSQQSSHSRPITASGGRGPRTQTNSSTDTDGAAHLSLRPGSQDKPERLPAADSPTEGRGSERPSESEWEQDELEEDREESSDYPLTDISANDLEQDDKLGRAMAEQGSQQYLETAKAATEKGKTSAEFAENAGTQDAPFQKPIVPQSESRPAVLADEH